MPITMRVSLPGYDCLTDGTIDHYALYSDQDYLLIKEQSSGSLSLDYAANGTINHNLSYIPMAMLWGEDINGNLVMGNTTNGLSLTNQWLYFITNNQVVVTQGVDSGTKTASYFVFYDNLT